MTVVFQVQLSRRDIHFESFEFPNVIQLYNFPGIRIPRYIKSGHGLCPLFIFTSPEIDLVALGQDPRSIEREFFRMMVTVTRESRFEVK